LKNEAAGSSETLIDTYLPLSRHIPEGGAVHILLTLNPKISLVVDMVYLATVSSKLE